MARYTGPTTRISRRFGQHILGSGKAFERRPFPPEPREPDVWQQIHYGIGWRLAAGYNFRRGWEK